MFLWLNHVTVSVSVISWSFFASVDFQAWKYGNNKCNDLGIVFCSHIVKITTSAQNKLLWKKEFIIFYDDEALGEVWNAFTGVLSRWPSGRANIGFTNCCFCPCCCHCKLQYAFHLLLCCCCLVLLCISYWQTILPLLQQCSIGITICYHLLAPRKLYIVQCAVDCTNYWATVITGIQLLLNYQ